MKVGAKEFDEIKGELEFDAKKGGKEFDEMKGFFFLYTIFVA